MSHSINTILITKIETVESFKEKSVKSDLQKWWLKLFMMNRHSYV